MNLTILGNLSPQVASNVLCQSTQQRCWPATAMIGASNPAVGEFLIYYFFLLFFVNVLDTKYEKKGTKCSGTRSTRSGVRNAGVPNVGVRNARVRNVGVRNTRVLNVREPEVGYEVLGTKCGVRNTGYGLLGTKSGVRSVAVRNVGFEVS